MKKVPFSVFLAATAILILFTSRLYSSDDPLKESEKKAYKADATYAEIAEDPEKYIKKEAKRCIKSIYNGYITKLPPSFEKLLPKNIFLLKIENFKPECPILFSSKNANLMKDITKLEQEQLITIYATLQQKVEKDDPKGKTIGTGKNVGKHYYLMVDDIDIAPAKKAVAKPDNGQVSEPTDADAVKYRLVDIQPKNYIDKNISFKIKFKDISNTIPAQAVKFAEISNDEYFVLLPLDTFSLPIIARRDNEACVPAIVDAEQGAKLALCGTVKCVGDPSDKSNKPLYYVLLLKATLETAPTPAIPSPLPAPIPQTPLPGVEKQQPSPPPPPVAAPVKTETSAPVIPQTPAVPVELPPSVKTQIVEKTEAEATGKTAETTENTPAQTPKKERKYIPSNE